MERLVCHMMGPFEDDLGHLNKLVELVRPKLLVPRELELVVFFSSTGGSNRHASMVYNYLLQLPFQVTMIALGDVCSASFYVYLAGQKRLAVPAAHFMLHEGTVSVRNAPRRELPRILKEFELESRSLNNLIQNSCGVSAHTARTWQKTSHVFSAEEAVRNGIVHKIITEPYLKSKPRCD